MAGIIEEGKSVMEEDFDDSTMDACLIAAGRRAKRAAGPGERFNAGWSRPVPR